MSDDTQEKNGVDELQRFRAREPLVKRFIAITLCTDPIEQRYGTFDTMTVDAARAVRDFDLGDQRSGKPNDSQELPRTSEASPVNAGETHELKTWPGPFQSVRDGVKTFEFRKDDRKFRPGDRLWLREYDLSFGYTGRDLFARVTYVLGGGFCIPEGYVCMSIKLEEAAAQPEAKPDAFRALTEKWKAEPYDYDPNAEAKPVDGDRVEAALAYVAKHSGADHTYTYPEDWAALKTLAAEVRRLRGEIRGWDMDCRRLLAEHDKLKAEVERQKWMRNDSREQGKSLVEHLQTENAKLRDALVFVQEQYRNTVSSLRIVTAEAELRLPRT